MWTRSCSYEHIVERGGRVADALRAFRTFLFGRAGGPGLESLEF